MWSIQASEYVEPDSSFLHLKSATVYLEIPDQNYQSISLLTTSGKINSTLVAPTDIQADGGGQSLKTTIGADNTQTSALTARSASGSITLED